MTNKDIINLLSPLGIKVAHIEYIGTADKYITFNIDELDSDYADDDNTSILYKIKLNYWCKNPDDLYLYKNIKQLLKSSGFRSGSISDEYEVKEKTYGKSMELEYIEIL